jgi:hypothetical protein
MKPNVFTEPIMSFAPARLNTQTFQSVICSPARVQLSPRCHPSLIDTPKLATAAGRASLVLKLNPISFNRDSHLPFLAFFPIHIAPASFTAGEATGLWVYKLFVVVVSAINANALPFSKFICHAGTFW